MTEIYLFYEKISEREREQGGRKKMVIWY